MQDKLFQDDCTDLGRGNKNLVKLNNGFKEICSRCRKIKPVAQFVKNKNAPSGLSSYCKTCTNQMAKAKAKKPRTQLVVLRSTLRRNYGLTVEQFEQMNKEQNGLCAICGRPETTKGRKDKVRMRLAVDHCHKTGKIRGLLCVGCNHALGRFNDDIELVQKALDYLKKYE